MNKTCLACQQEKNILEFAENKASPDNYLFKCKMCVNKKIKIFVTDLSNKICIICGETKNVSCFVKKENKCKGCQSKLDNFYYETNKATNLPRKKKYRIIHKDHYKEYNKEYREENKEILSEKKKQSYQENKEIILVRNKRYRHENRDKLRTQEKKRLENNPILKLRKKLTVQINKFLKKNGSSKNYASIIDFLPYSIKQLKEHLENQFESWMNWSNRGNYNPQIWDDNDSTTWAWQLDHIIPQSDLPYDSMGHPNFQKCWSLDNLRPLSAKQNILDGTSRTRHQTKKK